MCGPRQSTRPRLEADGIAFRLKAAGEPSGEAPEPAKEAGRRGANLKDPVGRP
jgi:hypothetical protein